MTSSKDEEETEEISCDKNKYEKDMYMNFLLFNEKTVDFNPKELLKRYKKRKEEELMNSNNDSDIDYSSESSQILKKKKEDNKLMKTLSTNTGRSKKNIW